jgi:ABC-type glycerol-3-phosphate transport system substrate-binding protein
LAESKKVLEVDYSIWSSDEVDKESYLNHYSRSVIRYGNRPMAVPLGNPHFAMLYDQTGISEEETKTERRGELPETWLELEQWLEQNDTKVEYPLAKGWAGHTLLGRVAPNARAVGSFSVLFDRTTMKPQISSPPFVEALEKIKQFATKSSLAVGPGETFQAVLNGKAVAALGWPAKPNENSSEAETGDGDERGSFAIGAVPGATRVFDFRRNEWKKRAANDDQRADLMGVSGLVVSIVAANQHEYSAIEFLKWVSDDKIILSVATDSPKTGPVRVSHLGNIGRWIGDGVSPELADEYATVVREIHQRNLVVLFPRIPGSNRYYSALDQGVRAVITGDQNPQQALKKVAEEWEEITGSIGREKQIQAMRRESGF